MTAVEPVILTFNGGSSSLKFSVARFGHSPERLLRGSVSGIGGSSPKLSVSVAGGYEKSQPVHAADHARAAEAVIAELGAYAAPQRVALVAHRVVHGGKRGDRARRITSELMQELRALSPLDPDHLPAELALIEAVSALAPNATAVCCFDTAFHATLPRVARLLAIPREYAERGVTRYGFHGLSYTFLLKELARLAGERAARGRVILAHLGAGASLCAVRDGRCVDTTMGFTPTSGVPMATRSGDVDPGALLWLLREDGLSVDALDDLLNHRSGLLGVSGISGDVRELLEREASEPAAREALSLFCYQVRKAIGALAATIGGVDTLVFSGGIGERSPVIRARCVDGLQHLGVLLDEQRNDGNSAIISADSSACSVHVIATDEEAILAEEAFAAHERDSHPASEAHG